ncbi:hypothetical protein ACFWJY_04265, partial [Streptomyces anulatus]
MPHRLTTERLALFATLLATFGELHPACDHWAQGSKTASRKRLYGEDLVHADGIIELSRQAGTPVSLPD